MKQHLSRRHYLTKKLQQTSCEARGRQRTVECSKKKQGTATCKPRPSLNAELQMLELAFVRPCQPHDAVSTLLIVEYTTC